MTAPRRMLLGPAVRHLAPFLLPRWRVLFAAAVADNSASPQISAQMTSSSQVVASMPAGIAHAGRNERCCSR